MSHIVDAITKKEREMVASARAAGYSAGAKEWRSKFEAAEKARVHDLAIAHQEGMREGYSSRVKDEAAARRTDTRVTAWSVGGNEDDTITLNLTGNTLDAEEAHDIAAALWHHVNVIQNRRAR